MSQKNKKSRQSLPPMNFNPWMMMGPHMMNWQEQMGMMPTTSGSSSTVTKSAATAKKHPWDNTDSDSSGDDDFQPSSKKGKISSGSQASQSTQAKKKRKPGRPKKETTLLKEAQYAEDLKIVEDYPEVNGSDFFPTKAADECKSCRLWAGHFAIISCGHGKYCFSCIRRLREKALKLKRPAQCPSDDCLTLVKSWVKLYNISF